MDTYNGEEATQQEQQAGRNSYLEHIAHVGHTGRARRAQVSLVALDQGEQLTPVALRILHPVDRASVSHRGARAKDGDVIGGLVKQGRSEHRHRIVEHTRLVASNSADQHVYVVPPTRSVDPSESLATCSAVPEVPTATHPGAPTSGQAPPWTTHETFSVVPTLPAAGFVPVTATWLGTEPLVALTDGAFNLDVTSVPSEHAR